MKNWPAQRAMQAARGQFSPLPPPHGTEPGHRHTVLVIPQQSHTPLAWGSQSLPGLKVSDHWTAVGSTIPASLAASPRSHIPAATSSSLHLKHVHITAHTGSGARAGTINKTLLLRWKHKTTHPSSDTPLKETGWL